jgi:hypothetical protein
MAFYPSRATADITKGGGLNTAAQDVLLRLVKPNTPLSGKINEPGVYTQDHKIPSDEWNKTVGTSHVVTNKMLQDWGINP